MEVSADAEPEGQTEMEKTHQVQVCSLWKPIRRNFATGADFFHDGDIMCGLMRKLPLPDDSEINGDLPINERHSEDPDSSSCFCCHVATCKKIFTSVASYEMHYSALHRNVCTECYRHFPTNHLLDIHIQEWHNPMFQLQAAKQSMYQCLVEICGEKFLTSRKRKDHLIKVHSYPSNFRFDRPLQKQKMAAEKKSKTPKDTPSLEEMKMDVSTGCMEGQHQSEKRGHVVKRQFLHSIPKTVCFGQGAQRSFQQPQRKKKGRGKKHWHQRHCDLAEDMDTTVNIEEIKLGDLAQALGAS